MSNGIKKAIPKEKYWELLSMLSEITTHADCLRYEMQPLGKEDLEAGAEPLTKQQIDQRLNAISILATQIALNGLGAANEDWYAVNDTVQ